MLSSVINITTFLLNRVHMIVRVWVSEDLEVEALKFYDRLDYGGKENYTKQRTTLLQY